MSLYQISSTGIVARPLSALRVVTCPLTPRSKLSRFGSAEARGDPRLKFAASSAAFDSGTTVPIGCGVSGMARGWKRGFRRSVVAVW